MRIAIVSSASSDSVGGLSSYMRLLETNLRELNHEVVTAARFVSENPPAFTDYAAVESDGIVSHKSYPTKVFGPNGAYVKSLRELNHFVNRPILRGVAKKIYVGAYKAGLHQSLPSDLDHLHYVGTGQELLGFAVLNEARQRRIGMSVWPAVHPGRWGDGPLDIELYNCADFVFCQSVSEHEHLRAKGVSEDRLVVTGLGPATNLIGEGDRFRSEHGLAKRRIVLFVGRKDCGKGYHSVCSAMPAVCAAIPDACLVSIGPSREPPYPTVPEGALLDLGVAEEFEKADALAACDVFCMPSVAEAFGIVYVEAWANRKVVIGGMAPAVRELITDNVNGLCVSQNPDEIADALIRLLVDEPLRRRMGEEGYRLQQEKYNWKTITNKHLEVFNAAVKRGRK